MPNNGDIKLIATLDESSSEAEIIKGIQILNSKLKANGNAKIKLDADINTKEIEKEIQRLQALLQSKNATNINVTGNVNGKGIITSVKNTMNQAKKVASQNSIPVNFDIKKDKLINDIKILGQQNSKLFKDANMTSKYNSLLDNAKLATSNSELKNLRLQLSAMRSELKATNMSGLALGDAFKKTFKRATELFTGTGGVMLLSQQLRQAWNESLNLDKSFTDLIKVQDELSRGDYPEYLEQCNKKAQELATTQQGLIDGATEFSKSGYNLTTSNKLTEQSTILSNVGEMSASDSAKAIISGIQAYDTVDGYTDAVDKAQALIDKYNAIGNTASITSAEIAQGVQAVGSVFADANTSVDEFIALLSAGNRQFQNADSLALGLRTAALRIRGCTTELQLMNEETDGVYTSASKLQEKIADLTNVDGSGGVQILEADQKTFKSIYDIFVDLSKVYQQMSDTDQSALLELIAGKHRASGISAVLNNMAEAQEIYERSLNSAGSAQEEYDKYLQSSEVSLNKFKASMTETYQSVINGQTTKAILDAGNGAVQFANSLGLVESSLKGLIAIGVVKVITKLSTAFKASAIQASNFGTALNTAKKMSSMAKGTTEYANALKVLKSVSIDLSETQLKQVLANKSLGDSERIAILRTTGLTKAQAQAKLAQLGLTQSTNAQTTANASATASTFSLTAAIKGFSASVKAAFMNNLVGISIMALSMLIGAVSTRTSEYNEKVKETRQANIDASESAKEKADSLRELCIQYDNLNSITNRTSSQEEKFRQVVQDITKALGDKAEALNGLTAGTDEYTASLKEATKAELETQYATAKIGAKAAEEALKDKTYSNWSGSKITIQQNEQMTGVKEHMAALNAVKDILAEYEDLGMVGDSTVMEWEPVNWDKNRNDMNAVVDYYNALIKARDKIVTADNADFLMSSDIYEDINTTINDLSDSVEKYTEQQYNALKLNYEWQNGVPSTEEEFQKMEQSILASSGAGQEFQEILKDYLAEDFSSFTNSLDDVKNGIDDIAEASDEVADTKISFTDIFNSSEFAEAKNKLLELASAGELTPKTLESTEDYKTLLDKTSLSAQYCCERINDLVTAQEKLANITSGLSSLTDLYKQANENGYVDINDISKLGDAWKDLSSYEEFVDIVGSGTHSMSEMQDAFDKLTSEYLTHNNALNKLNESNKDLYINQLKNAGISNAQAIVEKKLANQYMADMSTYEGLTQANKDLYVEKLKNKDIANAEQIVQKVLDAEYIAQTDALNGLTEANKAEYEAKLKAEGVTNANTIITNKLSAEKEAEETVTEKLNMTMDEFNSKSYEVQNSLLDEANASTLCRNEIVELQLAEIKYNNQGLDVTGKINQLKDLAIAYGIANTKAQEMAERQQKIDDYEARTGANTGTNYTKADEKLAEEDFRKQIDAMFAGLGENTSIDSNYNGGSDYQKELAKNTEKANSEAEKSVEIFDWIETKLTRIQTVISEFGQTASNVFKSLTDRSSAYGSQISKVTEEISLQQQAYDAYMQKANSVGLSEEYASKVRNGAMNIDEISDETLKTQISDYQIWYDKAQDCLNTVNDLQEELAKLNIDRLQLSIDKSNAGLEKTQSKADSLQKKIDNENRVTKVSDYDKLDANYNKQIQYYNEQNALLREQQQYVDKDSEKWIELEKNIRDNNTAISDLKDNIKENVVLRIQIKLDKQSNDLDEIEKAYDRIQDKISLRESSDQYAVTKDYDNLNKNISKHIKKLQEQNKTYADLQKTAQKGSKAWNDYKDKIDDNNASIRQLTQSMIENSKAKADLIQTKTDDKVGKIDSADELLKAKIGNTVLYSKKNAYVNSEMNNIAKRQTAYDNNVKSYQSNLNSSKKAINNTKAIKANKSLLSKIKSYVKANKPIPTELITQANKLGNSNLADSCADYNSYLAGLETAKTTAELYKETSKQELADLAQEKSDNIQKYYDNRQSTYNQRATGLNNKIDLVQAQGYQVSTNFYSKLVSNEKKNNESLVTEREKLVKALSNAVEEGSIKKGSDEWYEMCQQINDVTNAIDESKKSIVEYQNQLRQTKWDNFDYLEERISQITAETDFMINQLSRRDLVSDDIGGLTEYGKATNALHISNYTTYSQQAKDYKREIDKINEELAKNSYDKDLITRKEELVQSYQDCIDKAQEEKYAVIDLYTQGYEALKNKIGEVIEEYTDLLDKQESAYNYQNTIADKTKQLAQIRKQLEAYNYGDTSEETQATVQKLKVSLEDAEKDLKDTQYDKFISDTKDILSDLQDNLSDDIDEIITNMTENFNNLIDNERQTSAESLKVVKEAMQGIGYTSTSEFNTVLDGTDIVKSTKEAIANTKEFQRNMLKFADKQVSSKDSYTAEDYVKQNDGAKTLSDDLAKAKKNEKTAKEKVNSKQADVNYTREQMDRAFVIYNNTLNQYGKDSKKTKEALSEFNNAKKTYDESQSALNNAKASYDNTNQYLKVMEFLSKYLDVSDVPRSKLSDLNQALYDNYGQRILSDDKIGRLSEFLSVSGDQKKNGSLYKKLKSMGINGFRVGSSNIPYDQIAMLAEEGQELQFDKSKGVIRTVGQGDMIFTHEMAQKLWDFAKQNPVTFDTKFTPTAVPEFNSTLNSGDVNINMGGIVMNGVNDPEGFTNELHKNLATNPKTIKIMQANTIGSLSKNYNSLGARKYL